MLSAEPDLLMQIKLKYVTVASAFLFRNDRPNGLNNWSNPLIEGTSASAPTPLNQPSVPATYDSKTLFVTNVLAT